MRGYPVRLHIPTGESKNETGSTPIKAGLEIHPDFDMDEIHPDGFLTLYQRRIRKSYF